MEGKVYIHSERRLEISSSKQELSKEHVNAVVIKVQPNYQGYVLVIVCGYAPSDDEKDDIKATFYNDLLG